jgi:hypothetical protein
MKPWQYLRRHPFPVRAHFRHSLVLTYAFPSQILEPLLPPGLVLDTYEGFGFLAIAMVQTESLRPSFIPDKLGRDFFLSGYRIFCRYRTREGRSLRGLRILRSDTNQRLMAIFGNVLTHYNYQTASVSVRETAEEMEIRIQTPNGKADLHVIANFAARPLLPPEGSPFCSLHDARRFAGPLPFTFDYEENTESIVLIEGLRRNWHPEPVQVRILENTFIRDPIFQNTAPILANAFHVQDIPYEWKRGVVEKLLAT